MIDLQTFPIVAKFMMIDFIVENNKCAHGYLEIFN